MFNETSITKINKYLYLSNFLMTDGVLESICDLIGGPPGDSVIFRQICPGMGGDICSRWTIDQMMRLEKETREQKACQQCCNKVFFFMKTKGHVRSCVQHEQYVNFCFFFLVFVGLLIYIVAPPFKSWKFPYNRSMAIYDSQTGLFKWNYLIKIEWGRTWSSAKFITLFIKQMAKK